MSKRPYQVAGEILYHSEGRAQVMNLDQAHYKIHEGDAFMGGAYFASIADAGTALVSFYGGSIMPHGLFEISTTGNCVASMVEGGTITGGTAATVYNRNRNSANVALGSMTHSGTLTGGTVLGADLIPGGGKNFNTGASGRSEHEVVGLINTVYTAQLVNVSGGAIKASVMFDFYEENVS